MSVEKKIIGIIFMLLLCCSSVVVVKADEKKELSELTAEECLEELLDYGLVIPEDYVNYSDLSGFVKTIVDSVIENPQRTSWYNFTKAQEFATIIRRVVLDYENIDVRTAKNNGIMLLSTDAGLFLHSTVLGEWSETYWNYRCYAYAINRQSLGAINPGYTLGCEYGSETIRLMTIDRMAEMTASDLQNLGYSNITYSRTKPSWQSGYRIIAIRKGDVDFHFMYMHTSSNEWRHKPGCSILLKYNYTNIESRNWTNEAMIRSTYYSKTTEYDSDVIYIKYKL